ncbi:MAG: TrmH family RNA methyltransferase [Flavobacteriales bacterium]
MKQITSLQNPLIKQILLLQEKARERKKKGLFVIEGLREIGLAIAGNYSINTLFICNKIVSLENTGIIDMLKNSANECIEISLEVYHKIAYRSSTEGVITIAKTKDISLENLKINTKNPLILIAEAPEKPGNIGALLRTADAANLDAVIIANPKTDLYNPNIIRSSVGTLFTNNIAVGTSKEIIGFLNKNNIAIYSAILQKSVPYTSCNFKNATALVVGTEATGLTEEWRLKSKKNIHIPMEGKIDSMNVSVAAGILIFEAKRQRKVNK